MEADDFGSHRPTILTNVPLLLRDIIQQIAARADLTSVGLGCMGPSLHLGRSRYSIETSSPGRLVLARIGRRRNKS